MERNYQVTVTDLKTMKTRELTRANLSKEMAEDYVRVIGWGAGPNCKFSVVQKVELNGDMAQQFNDSQNDIKFEQEYDDDMARQYYESEQEYLDDREPPEL